MRVHNVLLLFVLAGQAVHAASWEEIAAAPMFSAEIDLDSVRPRGARLIEGTFRFEYSSPQVSRSTSAQYISAEVKALFDCDGGRYVPYQRTEFQNTRSRGGVVGTASITEPESKLVAVVKDSVNEVMLRAACECMTRKDGQRP